MTTHCISALLLTVAWCVLAEGMLNLKTRMQTSSSPVHVPYHSPRAVDGLYGSDPLTNCFVSTKATTAWWRGDIGHMSRIINIDIQFREGTGRQNGYFLYVSNTSSWTKGILCYHDDDPDIIPAVIQNRTCEIDGRYVMVVLHSDSDAYAEICEIDVYGCPSNFYGEKCVLPCYCKQGCNVTSGICDTPDCQPGWKGIRCDTKCGPHMFGANCSHVCHCQESGCNHITGHCDKSTCLPGYRGVNCSQKCTSGTFGAECSKICHCGTSGCSHVTGICKTPGCSRGWHGTTCSEACGPGMFAEDCNQTCHCLVTGCNPFIGSCYEPGCEQDWSGNSCDMKITNESVCPTGKFGEDCAHACHCKIQGCDPTSGNCTYSGCDKGWSGDACNHEINVTTPAECVPGRFGKTCSQHCHCDVGDCDNTTGLCVIPGCLPGWRGAACDQLCDSGTFGYDCNETCRCLFPGCDHVNGTCDRKEVICQDGWTGDSCDRACPAGTFGARCSKRCYCRVPGCHPMTGTCDQMTAGCLNGWIGDACDECTDTAPDSVHVCPNTQDILTAIHDSVHVCPNTQHLLTAIQDTDHGCPNTEEIITAIHDFQDVFTAILVCVLFVTLLSVTGNAITMVWLVRRSCCKIRRRQDIYTLDGGIENKTYDDLNLPNNEETGSSTT